MSRATEISPIPPFEAGSGRTLLSASEANVLVNSINPLLMLHGGRGVKVIRSEAAYKIEFDADTLPEGTPLGNGSLNWQGEWSGATAYSVGDIVIRSSATNMTDAESATFVCLVAHTNQEPPAGETLSSTYWATLARGHWKTLVIRDTADATTGRLVANAGKVVIELDNNATPTRISFDKADNDSVGLPAALVGKTLTWRPVTLCNSTTGLAEDWYMIGVKVS